MIEINVPFASSGLIGHCHNQISLLVPEMNVAAGLAIDLEAQMLQSLDSFPSRDYWELEQIVRHLCQEMRAFAPWVPAPGELDMLFKAFLEIGDSLFFCQSLICHIRDQLNGHEIFYFFMNLDQGFHLIIFY